MSRTTSGRHGVPWVSWREALARKFPTANEARAFVLEVGLDPIRIDFTNRADILWLNILEEAQRQGDQWLRAVLDHAIRKFPDDDDLKRFRDWDEPSYAEGPDMAAIRWRGRGGPVYERVTGGQSALVSVSFLEKGMQRASAVARIKYQKAPRGTGFIIPGDLLVTNHHVLSSRVQAADATVQFNYQKTVDDRDAEVEELSLDPEAFFVTSVHDDITVIQVRGEPSKKWGAIEVEAAHIDVGDRVNIIQHPDGEQKQLSFFHNLVEYVGEGRIQYLTDTLPGSSGAPVFDRDWRLVALHHSGGHIPEPGSKERFYRNEGIHVERLLRVLRSKR